MRRTLFAKPAKKMEMITEGDQTIISESTDVSAALRRNEQLRQAGATKTKMGDHFAASIPITLLQEYALKKGLPSWHAVAQDDRLLDQFLNDPDYKQCRVYEGKVTR